MLLSTKNRTPGVPAKTLPRIELENQLASYTNYKVTLLSAPAGYGKTTLVIKFLKSIVTRSCWYSIDKSDNNPVTFWSYLIQSLKRLDVNIGKKSLTLLNSDSEGDQHAAIVQLIEDLNHFQTRYLFEEHAVLVLDDFQDIWDQRLLEQVNFFLEYIPENFHLFITCRTLPPLSVSKRSARGELLLIVKEQLRLTNSEAQLYVTDKSKLILKQNILDELVSAADGWFGALQILCSHLNTQQSISNVNVQSRLADVALLKNYIDHEVLNCLDQICYKFLVLVAPLPRFSEEMIKTLIGEVEGTNWLHILLDLNIIFLIQDDEGSWYSIHTLVRERLINQSFDNETPANTKLSNTLLGWLSKRGLWSDGFEFAIHTHNWNTASKLALPVLKEIIRSGQYNIARALITRFPKNILNKMPKLCLFDVWADYQNLGHDHAKAKLAVIKNSILEIEQDSQTQWECRGITSPEDLTELKNVVYIIEFQINLLSTGAIKNHQILNRVKSYAEVHTFFSNWCWNGLGTNAFLSGQLDQAIEYLLTAFYQSKLDKDGFCLLATLGCLGPALIFSGLVDRTYEVCTEAEQWSVEHGFDAVGLFTVIYRVRALALREENKLNESHEQLNLIRQSYRSIDPLTKLYHLWAEMVLALCDRGSTKNSREIVTKLERHFKSLYHDWHLGIPDPVLLKAILDVMDGEPKSLIKWSKSFCKRKTLSQDNSQQYTFELLVYCRFLLETGKNPIPDLKYLLEQALKSNNLVLELKSELLLAVYKYKQQDHHSAVNLMESVLLVSDKTRCLRTVLDEQFLLQPMLDNEDFIKQLMAKFSGSGNATLTALLGLGCIEDSTKPSNTTLKVSNYITELTKREFQVLGKLATGLSNEEIGNILSISTTTVKTHIANIYSKLHVKNRMHAISVARELEWI